MKITEIDSNMEVDNSRFPEGMRVLAVDDDLNCLTNLTSLLNKCNYQVTSLRNKTEALQLLKNNLGVFDIVLTSVDIDDFEGFNLLEAGREINIPVIMILSNDSNEIVMKGVTHGADHHLIKPVRLEDVQTLWQHPYRKNPDFQLESIPLSDEDLSHIIDFEHDFGGDEDYLILPSEEELGLNNDVNFIESGGNDNNNEVKIEIQGDKETSKSFRKPGEELGLKDVYFVESGGGNNNNEEKIEIQGDKETSKSFRKRGYKRKSSSDDSISTGDTEDTSTNQKEKKERLKWIPELHEKFICAINSLGGIDMAVPKRILELMNDVPGLTREHVASHLQKHRKILSGKADSGDNHLPFPWISSSSEGTRKGQQSNQGGYSSLKNYNRSWMNRSVGGYTAQLNFEKQTITPTNVSNLTGSTDNSMFQNLPQETLNLQKLMMKRRPLKRNLMGSNHNPMFHQRATSNLIGLNPNSMFHQPNHQFTHDNSNAQLISSDPNLMFHQLSQQMGQDISFGSMMQAPNVSVMQPLSGPGPINPTYNSCMSGLIHGSVIQAPKLVYDGAHMAINAYNSVKQAPDGVFDHGLSRSDSINELFLFNRIFADVDPMSYTMSDFPTVG